MADFLSTNTPRLKFTQTGPRGTHKMTFRFAPATTQAAALAAATPVIEAMIALCLRTTSWSAAEWAPLDSDVFLPIAFTPINADAGALVADNFTLYGAYANFVGRSLAGSRVAWYLFNVVQPVLTANGRLIASEAPALAGILDAIAANTPPIVGIDQNTFNLKPYANTGVNDQVAKKARATV